MTDEREVGIVVSRHAADRWRERHPEAHLHRDAVAAIFHLVQTAIREGRVAKRKPAWSQFVARRTGDDRNRYCWTEDEQVAFVLSPLRRSALPERDARYRKRWLVVTCLPRQDADEMGTAKRDLTRASIRFVNRQAQAGRRAGKGKRRIDLDTDHHG